MFRNLGRHVFQAESGDMSPHSNASKLDIKDDAGAKWNDAWTGKEIEGGRAIVADAPLERIPLFLKNGRTLPIVA